MMKPVLLCCALLALLSFAMATEPTDYLKLLEELESPAFDENFPHAVSFLELEGEGEGSSATTAAASSAPLSTYLPESGPYDNPATETTPTPTLPESPSCTIRGQTIFEIRKMRSDAKQIGMAIMYEIQIMEKRKTYIEQMTSYLNDRIRELNKVKQDLAAEQKWIQVSNRRIAELAQKEKLIKLQDVMTCIRTEQQRLNGESTSKNGALSAMKQQADAVNSQITALRASISSLVGSGSSSSATTANTANTATTGATGAAK